MFHSICFVGLALSSQLLSFLAWPRVTAAAMQTTRHQAQAYMIPFMALISATTVLAVFGETHGFVFAHSFIPKNSTSSSCDFLP